jgi:hypothetical protein
MKKTLLWENQRLVSATRWQHWFRDMFCNFYLAKNHKIAKNSTTTKAREKISMDLESLEFQAFFEVCLTKFQNNQILLNKMSHAYKNISIYNNIDNVGYI